MNLEFRLLNDFQRGFPLVPEPYGKIASALGSDAGTILGMLQQLLQKGMVSRIGAVFRANTVGASTLAALNVPTARLEATANLISGYREVNHNYEREHLYNLWFVITASNPERISAILREVEEKTGSPALYLPMIEEYYTDLGFDLIGCGTAPPPDQTVPHPPPAFHPEPGDARLITALQNGLKTVCRPYQEIGLRAGLTEEQTILRLQKWLETGIIKRMGVVVRHHELGFRANAMAVWDVPDEQVTTLGQRIAYRKSVTLCYRRRRDLPQWPYNLYCMVHGQDRTHVESVVNRLKDDLKLHLYGHQTLFSRRCFKQCGPFFGFADEAT